MKALAVRDDQEFEALTDRVAHHIAVINAEFGMLAEDIRMIRTALGGTAPWPEIKTRKAALVQIEDIQRAVERYYNVTHAELISARRTAKLVTARHVAMYLANMLTPRTLPYIGPRFGNPDHTHGIHAVR